MARAGTSWVVVIRMFTQFFLKEKTTKKALLKSYQQPVVLKATLGSLLSFPKVPSTLLPSLSEAQILILFAYLLQTDILPQQCNSLSTVLLKGPS